MAFRWRSPATEGILRHLIAKILLFFLGFQAGFFPSFFNATVGGSIELGAFDKITRSIELHVRFDFRHRENSALNLKMLLD